MGYNPIVSNLINCVIACSYYFPISYAYDSYHIASFDLQSPYEYDLVVVHPSQLHIPRQEYHHSKFSVGKFFQFTMNVRARAFLI